MVVVLLAVAMEAAGVGATVEAATAEAMVLLAVATKTVVHVRTCFCPWRETDPHMRTTSNCVLAWQHSQQKPSGAAGVIVLLHVAMLPLEEQNGRSFLQSS